MVSAVEIDDTETGVHQFNSSCALRSSFDYTLLHVFNCTPNSQ